MKIAFISLDQDRELFILLAVYIDDINLRWPLIQPWAAPAQTVMKNAMTSADKKTIADILNFYYDVESQWKTEKPVYDNGSIFPFVFIFRC